MKKLVLASGSPRRSRMLRNLAVEFSVAESAFVEARGAGKQSPREYVQQNARGKAQDVAGQFENAVVIGADTVVVCGSRLLGKPSTHEEAFQYLSMLKGKTHQVYTGICLVESYDNRVLIDYEKTSVRFRQLTDEQIRLYLERINPLDKAGAYAIQGAGSIIVESIAGCYYNVMGFPVSKLEQMLTVLGMSLFDYMKLKKNR